MTQEYTDWPLVDDEGREVGRRGGYFPRYRYDPTTGRVDPLDAEALALAVADSSLAVLDAENRESDAFVLPLGDLGDEQRKAWYGEARAAREAVVAAWAAWRAAVAALRAAKAGP